MDPQLVSKSEFAALINVSAGRVSQFIAAGQISPSAIVGSGQRAKINVQQAKADLRLTLDVAQRLGNGSETKLDTDEISVPSAALASAVIATQSGVDYEIKQQKLEQLRRANRNAAIADAASDGFFTETAAARAELSKAAAAMMMSFEAALNEFATALSAEYKMPARDVLHLLRREFRRIREKEAKKNADAASRLPQTLASKISAEDEGDSERLVSEVAETAPSRATQTPASPAKPVQTSKTASTGPGAPVRPPRDIHSSRFHLTDEDVSDLVGTNLTSQSEDW